MDTNTVLLPLPGLVGNSYRQPLTPTATEFLPTAIEAKCEVLESTFITQTVPNIHRDDGIVGLCTVPNDRADTNDLGWHITDFLAFRALLCGDNHHRAQSWLANCDILTLVESYPQRYIHGKEKRMVGSAATPRMRSTPSGVAEREDNIQVEISIEHLKEKFIAAVKEKLAVAKKMGYPLLLIICGPTSLEQDIYFGEPKKETRYTMQDLRRELGDDVKDIQVTIITCSLFSAGWQVNTSFGHFNPAKTRGDRFQFLARQFGGLFAQDITRNFLGWGCPVLDWSKADPRIKMTERYPGPVRPSGKVDALVLSLKGKIQSYLMGGLSPFHLDHSFSFSIGGDEWQLLIGRLEEGSDYQTLQKYAQRWAELPVAQISEPTKENLQFLGNAFGGTRTSQLSHIKHLIKESYIAWPDYWVSSFGQETKKDFERFMNMQRPQDLDCHEIFNILEHRARTSILADRVIRYFDLPIPHNQRCRDWDNSKWKQQLSETDRNSLTKYFGEVFRSVPGPDVPPGLHLNALSRLQRRLESGASYVRAALCIRFLTRKDSAAVAITRIESFIQDVKRKQAELIASNTEIYRMCRLWLEAINMPVRELNNAMASITTPEHIAEPEDTSGILDFDDEYDIYQHDDGHDFATVKSSHVDDAHDRHIDHVSPRTPAPEPKRKEAVAERSVDDLVTQKQETGVLVPEFVVARVSQGMVDLDAEEARLIAALQTTHERERRRELTTELLRILQLSQNMKEMAIESKAETSNDVAMESASNVTNDEATPTTLIAETEHRTQKNGWLEPRSMVQTPNKAQKVHERKTPPHLRGLDGRKYD